MTSVTAGSIVVGFLDGGKWSACFGLSYRDTLLLDSITDNRIIRPGGKELRKVCGSAGIAEGRNKVARAFLDETDGEWLWTVDTDMGFSADTPHRLLESADPTERPVVGALCFALVKDRRSGQGDYYAERHLIQPTIYSWYDGEDEAGFVPVYDYPRDSIAEVAGTGAACTLIHRSALEKVRARYGDCWYGMLTHPTGEKGKPRVFSEDLSFCVRLGACGIPIHVDTSVKTCHDKGGIYLDEETFDRQMSFELMNDNESREDNGSPCNGG